MKMAESSSLKHVQYFRAPDDRRPIAIFISGQFDEFEKFPPFMETEEEIQHVREAYKIADPLLERTTKAHITDNSWPLLFEYHYGLPVHTNCHDMQAEAQREYGLTPDDVHDSFNFVMHTGIDTQGRP